MPETPLVSRCVIGIDVEKYSVGRRIRQQDGVQRTLDTMLSQSAESAGLDRTIWDRLPAGDGEMAVLPECDLTTVVGGFVRDLDDRLAVHNEDHGPGMQIKLRMAAHIGLLKRSPLGYAGPALVVLSRLLNADELRRALRNAEDTHLALIVSSSMFPVVESGGLGLRPWTFRKIEVVDDAKGFSEVAYIHPANEVAAGRPSDGPPVPGPPPSREPAAPAEEKAGKERSGTMIGTQWNISGPDARINHSDRDMYLFETTADDA
ncbi:hypothetical protein [Sphaerisporangium corydalis]|nr:hypothetical protein [Sphaerisporangium corydalis]